ncbi:hypothetical protein KP509_21G004000 [Ceratopteris richardii]|uniref:Pentatricopeptide repeat-containing protein n=1 Tax=Ceratopteris richardii TaxID=49495 RepID=A0A8T2S733_CERRI|nr:hypothetical protein KP509_21G004000 [Ceratopteris richardii]
MTRYAKVYALVAALVVSLCTKGTTLFASNCSDTSEQEEGAQLDGLTFVIALQACDALAENEGSVFAKGDMWEELYHESIHPNAMTYACILKAYNNVEIGIALVDMYVKCGAFPKAKCVFDSILHQDVVCWNALIIKIHDDIERQGLLEVDIMVGNAQEVLHKLPFCDVVTWNALITGFAEESLGEQALSYFEKMQSEGISRDVVSFLCILNLCSHLGLVEKGYEYFEMLIFDRSANWIALLSASHKWGDIKVGSSS